MSRNFQQQLFDGFTLSIGVAASAAGDPRGPAPLLSTVGWQVDAIAGLPISSLAGAISNLETSLRSFINRPEPKSLEEVRSTLRDLAVVIDSLGRITTALQDPGFQKPPGFDDLGKDLLNLAVVVALRERNALLYHLGVLLSLIQNHQFEAVVVPTTGEYQRMPVVVPRLHLDRIGPLLKDPVGLLETEYGLQEGVKDEATAQAVSDRLFPRLASVLQDLGALAVYGTKDSFETDYGTEGTRLAKRALTVSAPFPVAAAGQVRIGGTFMLDPALGLIVRPFGDGTFSQILSQWVLDLVVAVGLEGLAIDRDSITLLSGADPSVSVALSATRIPRIDEVASDAIGPAFLLGSATGTRLEIGQLRASANAEFTGSTRDYGVALRIGDAALVIEGDHGDGFISKILPASKRIGFDLEVGWSFRRGFHFRGSGGLEIDLPVTLDIAGVLIVRAIHLGIRTSTDDSKLALEVSATAEAKLGPVLVTAERIGLSADLDFVKEPKNLGVFDLDLGFKPPTGLGISIDAGAISGGGFLRFEPEIGRYSGAVQLSIYSVSVSAFGIIETQFPDGREGFSFVIVISAEFPGLQLGFGFTLLGVGGIIGINRGLDANELGRLVLAGESGQLLFPKDLVANAPAIIRDLGAVFPVREGRYVFGPLAKLGWGTPTLIRGELGLILELPGGTLTILGEVRMRLPKEELPITSFNMSVLGFLDLPRKSFGLNAALHDSIINGYPVSGQMAMRLRWGEEPNFILSVGGFHPAYKPPSDFPKLQPLTLDLGKSGSVSVTVSGFFAVTSNTLQIGGDARLHAGGNGITLDATLGVKALFIFTPFSFEATIDASVKISFHGRGPSVHLHGVLSGPTPWRARGELCVSILFWDACLGFDEEFGGGEPVSVPEIDPWTGSAGPPEIIGLKQALDDPANWSTDPPPELLSVVALAEGAKSLVDPLGILIVRERIVPVETENDIERFGVGKTPAPIRFKLVNATLQGTVPLVKRGKVEDSFAPAQYFELDDATKLSAKSYEKHQAGYRLAANDRDVKSGSKVSFEPSLRTLVIAADGSATPASAEYVPTEAHVNGSATRSVSALFGSLQLGMRRYIDPRFTQPFDLPVPTFRFAHVTNLFGSSTAPPPASRTEALLLHAAFIRAQPEQRGRFQVVASHEIRGV